VPAKDPDSTPQGRKRRRKFVKIRPEEVEGQPLPPTTAAPAVVTPLPDPSGHPVYEVLRRNEVSGYKPPYLSMHVLMTLEVVEALLEMGGNFRSISLSRKALYQDMMLADRWIYPMEPFYVSRLWTLDDGQHTAAGYREYLLAGGTPQIMEVRILCPPEWADVMDAAMNRTNSQKAKHLGYKQPEAVSAVTLALWQLALDGVIGHSTSPPDLIRELLGPADASRMCTYYIHEGVKLADRIKRSATQEGQKPPAGITPPSLGAVLAMLLREDEQEVRLFADRMIRAADFVVASSHSTGPEAAMAMLLQKDHGESLDRSRHDRKLRTMIIVWKAWRHPDLNYDALKRDITSKTLDVLERKTKEQWDRIRGEVQQNALELLEL